MEPLYKWFTANCKKVWEEREMISLHRPIFVAFGFVVFFVTAVAVGLGEYAWFQSTISSRDNEIRIKNATIEQLQAKTTLTSTGAAGSPTPAAPTMLVPYTSLRLLMRPNQDPSELKPKNNVWKWWTQPVNISDQSGLVLHSTRFFFVVFDNPAATNYRRVFSSNKPNLLFAVIDLTPRYMIVVSQQDITDAIIEFETSEQPL